MSSAPSSPPKNSEQVSWRDHSLEVFSSCGRVYSIPMEKIHEDYTQFREGEEGTDKVDVHELRSWFMSQFTWDDVERLGTCVRQPTQEEIARALNVMRNRDQPQSNTRIKRRDDWIAGRTQQQMDAHLPPASPSPKGRM